MTNKDAEISNVSAPQVSAIRLINDVLRTCEFKARDFVIDMLRCIYCGMCEGVCPEEAIFLKNDFAITAYKREELQFHKEKLLELGGVHDDKIWKWKNK